MTFYISQTSNTRVAVLDGHAHTKTKIMEDILQLSHILQIVFTTMVLNIFRDGITLRTAVLDGHLIT